MLTPRWAHKPLSGEGAAEKGGRANRQGVEALYLSLDPQTALKEYQQLSRLMPPGTLVAYELDVSDLVDFREGYEAKTWSPLWEDFNCDWRELSQTLGVEPPSWVIGDEVIAAGCKGILFPSVANPGGVNLVLYTATLNASDKVAEYDPDKALPKDQSSWTP